jgi:hypothetical protein
MYQVGCLAALEDRIEGLSVSGFDLYVGTAAGATVATALAGGLSIQRMYRALLDPADDFFPLSRHHLLRVDVGELLRVFGSAIAAARHVVSSAASNPLDVKVWSELERFVDSLPAGIFSLSRDEAGAEALVRLGDLLLRRGNATATIEELGRLDVLYAGYPEWQAQGYLVQARAFTNLGRIGDATQVYDRVIENFYDTPYAEVARKEKEAL